MLPRGGGMFPRREKIPRNRPVALQQAEVSEAIAPTLSSLPSDLLSLVAETCNRRELLDVQCNRRDRRELWTCNALPISQ